jgi:hypothetical protein
MYLRLLVVSIAFALGACSSGGSSDGTTTGGDTGGDTGGGDTAGGDTGGGNTGDTKAGVWQGDMGFGPGVYVIDNANNLYGLATAHGGSYNSFFGNLGTGDSFNGQLDTHFHPASNAIKGSAFAPQGEDVAATAINVNIVNGQTIESLDTNNPFTLTFATNGLQPAATIASVAGSWSGVHSFCSNATDCQEFTIDLTFNGTTLTGATGVNALPTGDNVFPVSMSGTISEFGSVLTTQYTWGTRSLNGVIYFDDNGDLILNGDSAAEQTISSKLSR